MISLISARRLLCCLMAALTLFGALSPAFFQPAEAVAVADDVLIASLGLLAMSWAGISFSSCAGAQTAVNSFLSSKPAAKLSLAGLMTKELVVDGSKLLLTSDVRDVFKSVLPHIQDFFQVKSDTVASSGSGALLGGSVVGFTFPQPVARSQSDIDALPIYPFTLFDGCRVILNGRTGIVSVRDPGYFYVTRDDGGYESVTVPMRYGGSSTPGGFIFFTNSSGECLIANCVLSSRQYFSQFNSTLTILSSPNSVDFKQSKEVDGTSALEILAPAPLYVVNPGGSSGGDGSQKPEIDFSKVAFISLAGLYGLLSLSGNDALKDPGLDPEQMVDQLQKAMESTQTEPKPEPEPEPQPDPDPDTPGGSSGTAPDFNGMMLPGLKDFFPFCIPFDLKKMMDALCADPVAPKFTFATSFLGQVYTVDIDLSAWDGVATTVRYMVVATYIVCLAVATRKFIKW